MSNKNDARLEHEIRDLAAQFGVAHESPDPEWTDRAVATAIDQRQSHKKRVWVTTSLVIAAAIAVFTIIGLPRGAVDVPETEHAAPAPTHHTVLGVNEKPTAVPLSESAVFSVVNQSESIISGELVSVDKSNIKIAVKNTSLGPDREGETLDLTSHCLNDATVSGQTVIAFITPTGDTWLYVNTGMEFAPACSPSPTRGESFTQSELEAALTVADRTR